jgi:outer membrane protein assembly factor BamB
MRWVILLFVITVASAAWCAVLTEKWSYPIEKGQRFIGGPVAFASKCGARADRLAIATSKKEVLVISGKGQFVWRAGVGQEPKASPAIADLDRDGRPEVLVAHDGPGLVCLSVDGKRLWSAELPAGAVGEPAVGDISAAPGLEVVVADDENGVTCLSARGRVLWRTKCNTGKRPENADPFIGPIGFWWPRYRNDDMGAPATVADVDGDGRSESLAASSDRHTYCLSGDGTWKWDIVGSPPAGGFHARPVAADLDGDGRVEVLAGCLDRNIYCAEGATGRVLWKYACEFGMDSAITTADLDGDGKLEVLAGDQKCYLHCIDAAGKARWKLALHPGESIKYFDDRILVPPAVADVDGDGRPEIIVAIANDPFLYVVSADGRLVDKYQMEQGTEIFLAGSGIHGPIAVGDFDGDGQTEIAAAARLTALRCLSTGALWNPLPKPARPMPRGRPSLHQRAPRGSLQVSVPSRLYLGENVLSLSVSRLSVKGSFVAEAVVRPPVGPATVLVEHLQPGSEISAPTFEAVQPGRYAVSARLVAEGSKVVASATEVTAELIPGAAERALAETAARALEAAAGRLQHKNPGGAEWLRHWAAWMRARKAEVAEALASGRQQKGLETAQSVRRDAQRALETAACIRSLHDAGADTRLVVWEARPWERFLETSLPPVKAAKFGGLSAFTYVNEYESLAFNVANFAGDDLHVRLLVAPLAGRDGEVASRDHVILRQVQIVPRKDGLYSSDALPLLGEPNIMTLPRGMSRQVWITLRTKGLPPGRYSTTITVRSLTTKPIEKKVALAFDVLPIALPEKSPLSFCNWAYVETQVFKDMADVAVADLVEHYTTVFPTGMFVNVKYDSAGDLLPIDWTRFDELVCRYMHHGRLLFQGWDPLQHDGAASEKEGARERAFAAWMRALAQHMLELGVGYEGWAIYITDEPGLDRGPSIEYVIENGKCIRAADPKIRIYTDPVNEMAIPDLERIRPYIDIWCPNQETFFPISDPKPETQAERKLAFFKSTGGEIWIYECHPRAKRFRPDGYYRNQAWLAWKLGITGMGFWVYDVSPYDMWDPIHPGQEYVLVYPSPTGPVPSKRWEACREGIEDYMYLYLLREAVSAAEKTNPTLAAEGRELLDEAVARVFGSRINYETLMSYRKKIAEMTLRLRGLGGEQ